MHLSNKIKIPRHEEKVKVLNSNTLANLRESMQTKLWDNIYNCNDPDLAYNMMIQVIINTMWNTIPEKAVKKGTTNNNWITKDILKRILTKINYINTLLRILWVKIT